MRVSPSTVCLLSILVFYVVSADALLNTLLPILKYLQSLNILQKKNPLFDNEVNPDLEGRQLDGLSNRDTPLNFHVKPGNENDLSAQILKSIAGK